MVRASAERSRDSAAAQTDSPYDERVGSENKASTSTRAKGPTRPRRRSDDRPDTKDLFGLFTHPAMEMKVGFFFGKC